EGPQSGVRPMSPRLPRLRRALFRPWPAALLVGLLAALLFGALGLWLANRQAQQAESERLQAQGQRFLQRIEQVFGQLGDALDELEQQPLRGCDLAMVETLRRVVFQHRFVYEAAFIGGDQRCSSSPRRSSLGPERPPDIEGRRQRYCLNTAAQPDDDLAALVVGRGSFRLSPSRGHLADRVELPAGGSLRIVSRASGQALPVLGAAQSWPPAAGWPADEPLLLNARQLIYRMPT